MTDIADPIDHSHHVRGSAQIGSSHDEARINIQRWQYCRGETACFALLRLFCQNSILLGSNGAFFPKSPSTNLVRTYRLLQVTRNEAIVKGKLLQKLSEGKTANPRWLVAFVDEPSWKDEELYEAVFGKHLPKETGSPQKHVRSRLINAASKKSSKSGNSAKNSSSSDAEASHASNSKKKSVSFTEFSPTVSEAGSSPRENRSSRSSAREQRCKRRHAQVEEEEVVVQQQQPSTTTNKRAMVAPVKTLPDNNKKARKDEDVIKVPMLTGTLYLYRGPVRRAEFVRHS